MLGRLSSTLPLSGIPTPAGTPTSLNRSNVTLADMSQATKSIIAVSPEWSKTWFSVAETAAWSWCRPTRSSITRWTLPSHLNAACHSLLPEVMLLVLCSHNAAVLHTQTPSHALPGTGTCCLLIHQHSIPLTPSRTTWTPNHRLNIVLTSSCYPAGNAACLAAVRSSSVRGCTFVEEEERNWRRPSVDSACTQ